MQLGLSELPVVVRPADESESIELALIENLQRKNLTAFEEAEALQALVERFTYTHEQLAKRLGKSRTSITETLSLNAMPHEVQRLCRLADIASKSVLLEIVRQRSPEAMPRLPRADHARRRRDPPTRAGDGEPPQQDGSVQAVRVPVRASEPDVQPAAGVPEDERAAGIN